MSEKEVKKCPKCGGTMMETDPGRRWVRFFSWWVGIWKRRFGFQYDYPYHCKNCGYIELYKRLKKE